MRTNLFVPFEEKDEAKRLGARWDLALKVWFVENVDDLTPFLKWIDKRSKQPTKLLLIPKNPRVDAVRYFVKTNKTNQKAHIISGGDTLCKMKSSGGLSKVRVYKVVLDYGDRKICRMCFEIFKKKNGSDFIRTVPL